MPVDEQVVKYEAITHGIRPKKKGRAMNIDTNQLLANVARFLSENNQEEAARLLVACSSCSLDKFQDWGRPHVYVAIAGPRAVYEKLKDQNDPITKAVRDAFTSLLPPGLEFGGLDPRVELSPVDADWRTQLLDKVEGRSIDNQGIELAGDRPAKLWMNLRFRSASEIRVAEALERAGVLFLPNCKARLGAAASRETREADFLVCKDGKWGILEVDGEPFHPPARTVHDHQRDRLFQAHGILIVQHFDATECFENADHVVRKFLEILRQA